MPTAYIRAAAATAFGRHEGSNAIGLMARAAHEALLLASLRRCDVDGLLCGYATTMPHLMLADLFAERFALRPTYAHGVQMGGATGAAMLMLARELVLAGRCKNVLVVAGENRLTGQTRDSAIQTLAQVGDATTEVPNGASVPAYYALMASRYLHQTGLGELDLAEFAVAMRARAAAHPGAHLRASIGIDDVMASKPISSPLKLLDCSPISDGAAAIVVSAEPGAHGAVKMAGAGQAHQHQHLTAMDDVFACGASAAARVALAEARLGLDDIGYLAIYDSFTITLLMLLEEIGFAARGEAAARIREGHFSPSGSHPLNTHGGLLSYGHSGVAGGMAHAVETWLQLTRQGGDRQIASRPRHALLHADGGVMSSHVSLVLSAQ